MAAQYTNITLEDFDGYLKRAFRALRPKQAVCKGEYCYHLSLSPNVRIQILTAISRGADASRGVGTDTIKLMLVGSPTNRPLLAGKGSSLAMKRTQGWKTTLQDRIEDLVELYEERQAYWEQRAGGQIKQEDDDLDDSDAAPKQEEEKPEAPRYDPSKALTGTFTKDNRSGGWAARITGTGAPGAKALLETKGGRKVPVVLRAKLWAGNDQYTRTYVEVWSIDESRKLASSSLVSNVVSRFKNAEYGLPETLGDPLDTARNTLDAINDYDDDIGI